MTAQIIDRYEYEGNEYSIIALMKEADRCIEMLGTKKGQS